MFLDVAKFWNKFVYQNCILKSYIEAKDGKSFQSLFFIVMLKLEPQLPSSGSTLFCKFRSKLSKTYLCLGSKPNYTK